MDPLQNTSYNYQHQSILAKLLAKEDITVTHGKFDTAFFDVKSRTLGLPIWKDRGKEVYDMLVGHEVGHALYTPENSIEEYKKNYKGIPFDVFNIVEDIRIERLIQKEYPGLPRVFKKAYKTLVDSDFFKIADKDIATMNFLNRLNLRGKVGTVLEVTLSEYEETIYTKCLKAETYQDVLDICDEIIEYLKSLKEEPQKEEPNSNEEGNDDSDESESPTPPSSGTEKDSDDPEELTEEDHQKITDAVNEMTDDITDDGEESFGESTTPDEDSEADTSEGVKPEDDASSEFSANTLESFKQSLKEDESDINSNWVPMTFPTKKNSLSMVNKSSEVLKSRKENDSLITTIMGHEEFGPAYSKFKKETKTKVGVLIREFERRKAAYQYSRATESRSGVINVNKLHKYKYDDQIFSSVTSLADAKSHGMVFLLDYSGSMNMVLPDVQIQTLNLVHFCKSVNIPFEVYSFTSNCRRFDDRDDSMYGQTEVDTSDCLVNNILSSDLSKKDYEFAFESLYAQAWAQKNHKDNYLKTFGSIEDMGGTPLDSTLLSFYYILESFNKKHNVQKLNLVVLTDGDSSSVRSNGYGICGRNQVSHKGKMIDVSTYNRNTNNILKYLKSQITNLTTIGMFLPERPSSIKERLRYHSNLDRNIADKKFKEYKKCGFLTFDDYLGYDSYTFLPANVELNDEKEFTFEGQDSNLANSKMAQNKLVKQFSEFNSAKKRSRIILTKFAETIA